MQVKTFYTSANKIDRVGLDELIKLLPREDVSNLVDKKSDEMQVISNTKGFVGALDISDGFGDSSYEKLVYNLFAVPSEDDKKINLLKTAIVSKHLPYATRLDLRKHDNLRDALEEAAVECAMQFGFPRYFTYSNGELLIIDPDSLKVLFYTDTENLQLKATVACFAPKKLVIARVKPNLPDFLKK